VPAPLRISAAAWGIAWVVGGLVFGSIALAAMGVDLGAGEDLTIPQLTVAAAVAWATFAVALFVVGNRYGTGDPLVDYRVAFRPIDLLAIPAGVATQLALVPALYWPLQQLWPDTFSSERLEERARELADGATGGTAVLLVVVVAIGAPLFEELVYRGLIQRSLAATIGPWPGLIAASVWFGVIHLAPVELPGLVLAGFVFGLGLHLTDRLGPSMLAHVAFNATGLAIAFSAT
jgi:membrane protease YdiL (CAAX protease family)